MKIPNYDVQDNIASNYKQLFDFMPNQCFRMLICGFCFCAFCFCFRSHFITKPCRE